MFWSRNSDTPWGYAIYRTVYTEHSSQVWAAVIAKFESYLLHSVRTDNEVRSRGLVDELEETYKSVVFDDASKFEGMSIRRVRRHWLNLKGEKHESYDEDEDEEDEGESDEDDNDEVFACSAEERAEFLSKGTKFECCILIDEEVLQSILDAPDTPEEGISKSTSPFDSIGYVKIVDQQSGSGSGEDYPGWMKVDLTCLWDIWDLDDLESQYPYEDPNTGERFVYTGGPPMQFFDGAL